MNADVIEQLIAKEKVYRGLAQYHRGHYGFVHTDKCDSLLLSCLVGVRKDFPIDIFKAQDNNGYWHRRPISLPECYPDCSKSSMSRDMLLGLLFYSTFNKKSPENGNYAYRILSDLQINHYILGIGDPSRIIMMPGLERSFSRLAGFKSIINSSYQPWSGNLKGYAAKLEIIHIMCLGKIDGAISDKMLNCLKKYSDYTKNNILALFLCAAYSGDQSYLDKGIKLLQTQSLFPNNRLPTSSDRSVDWYFDEQNPNDVAPNEENKEHPGADFLFYMWVLKYVLNIME